MPTNDFQVVDYSAEAKANTTYMFKDKPVFAKYLSVVLDEVDLLQSTLKDLMQLRSLDTATGAQLDVIGALVGQPRELVDFTQFTFFGFDDDGSAETFAEIDNPDTGGYFASLFDATGAPLLLNDELYRFIIKARILANKTAATSNDILTGINFLMGTTNSTIVDQPNAHLMLEFARELTSLEQYFIKGLSGNGSIVPVPVGVTLEFLQFVDGEYFGFDEDPLASGFTDSGGTIGGYFSTLL